MEARFIYDNLYSDFKLGEIGIDRWSMPEIEEYITKEFLEKSEKIM